MPILTIRLSEEELAATEQAARLHHLNKSEFARRAITAAAAPAKAKDQRYPLGVLKGKVSYKQAMKLLRG
jgi:hypothetical protein